MEEFNPYAAPAAPLSVEPEPSELVLADRGSRFVAQLVDGLVLLIPAAIIVLGISLGIPALVGPRWEPGWPFLLGFGALQFVLIMGIYFAINGRLLATRGQTVGKKACGIKIVRLDGTLPTLGESFWRRYVLVQALAQIPFLGGLFGLVDVCFIFRESRRCLHDEIAGTLVVKA
ncbi:MAG: RDD family protein [Holophagaceae bacterium]